MPVEFSPTKRKNNDVFLSIEKWRREPLLFTEPKSDGIRERRILARGFIWIVKKSKGIFKRILHALLCFYRSTFHVWVSLVLLKMIRRLYFERRSTSNEQWNSSFSSSNFLLLLVAVCSILNLCYFVAHPNWVELLIFDLYFRRLRRFRWYSLFLFDWSVFENESTVE